MLIFHVVGGVGVSLLSLIPRLIKRSLHVCVVSVGVAGWNTSAAWFEHGPVFVAGGLAHCWVLRRHSRVRVCSWSASWLGFLTRSCGCGGAGGWGCGCVLSVA